MSLWRRNTSFALAGSAKLLRYTHIYTCGSIYVHVYVCVYIMLVRVRVCVCVCVCVYRSCIIVIICTAVMFQIYIAVLQICIVEYYRFVQLYTDIHTFPAELHSQL